MHDDDNSPGRELSKRPLSDAARDVLLAELLGDVGQLKEKLSQLDAHWHAQIQQSQLHLQKIVQWHVVIDAKLKELRGKDLGQVLQPSADFGAQLTALQTEIRSLASQMHVKEPAHDFVFWISAAAVCGLAVGAALVLILRPLGV